MNATMPSVDSADLDKLKNRMPDLSDFELPKLESVGRTADDTINRLLGRPRRSAWPWVGASLGIVAVVGVIAAAFLWMRRWAPEPALETAEAGTLPAVSTAGASSELGAPAVTETV